MEPIAEHGNKSSEANVLWFCTEACQSGSLLEAIFFPDTAKYPLGYKTVQSCSAQVIATKEFVTAAVQVGKRRRGFAQKETTKEALKQGDITTSL